MCLFDGFSLPFIVGLNHKLTSNSSFEIEPEFVLGDQLCDVILENKKLKFF